MTPTATRMAAAMRPGSRLDGRQRSSERGAVGFNLTIFLAFALYAVVQLTRTVIAAQQIDDRVDSIIVTTPEIAQSLTNVPKLDDTLATAQQIEVAAAPLTGHLDAVLGSAGRIESTVININESAAAINGSVNRINGTVSGILGDVRQIGGSVSGINSETVTIRQGVAAINGRADVVIGQANRLGSDLANVLAEVGGPAGGGTGPASNFTIVGHANSICRAVPLPTRPC